MEVSKMSSRRTFIKSIAGLLVPAVVGLEPVRRVWALDRTHLKKVQPLTVFSGCDYSESTGFTHFDLTYANYAKTLDNLRRNYPDIVITNHADGTYTVTWHGLLCSAEEPTSRLYDPSAAGFVANQERTKDHTEHIRRVLAR
jgi:hypothetical protein